MASFRGWEAQLLRALKVPVSSQNISSLREWQRREGGTAAFNPLNTTQHAEGASSYNSVGVRNYRNPGQGVRATAQTLTNGRYGDIMAALAKSQPLGGQASLKVWGTGTWAAGAGGGGAAPPSPRPAGLPAVAGAPATPSFTVQDAMKQSLQALASGTYDPIKGLQAMRKAALATQSAAQINSGPGGKNFGSMLLPVVGPQGSKFGTKAARMVQDYLGVSYVWGGESPKGFDCSGLLQWVWGKLGVQIPRVTYDQWKVGRSVGKGQLRPGDAVFFRGSDARGNLPGHVGMFIGNNEFIEAPHTGAVVRISSLAGRRDYQGARRYA